MELLLIGTGAAEGIPNPYCLCPICERARQKGGRDVRARSSALLDDVVMIDYGPDVHLRMQALGRSLAAVTTLVFTHHHDDHLAPSEIQYRGPWFAPRTPLPDLYVYGNETVLSNLKGHLATLPFTQEQMHIVIAEEPLRPFEPVVSPDGTEILPLPADHAPKALTLLLSRNGRRVFYGHDSGLYPDETVAALAGKPLDLALFDCTSGPRVTANRGHMGISGVLASVQRLRDVGAITEGTRLVATHFAHNAGVTHDELCVLLEPQGVEPAYDGMKIDIGTPRAIPA